MAITYSLEKIMTLDNAIQKLQKHGFKVTSNLGSYIATRRDTKISFFSQNEKTSKFTFSDKNACEPTYGLSLKMALEFSYM